MSKIKLYHGSNHIVGKPEFAKGKPYNDYGLGFYCTESIELAKEWACSEKGVDGYANAYTVDITGLNILDLSDYNILNWLAILLSNRKVNMSLPNSVVAKNYILEHFSVDTSDYDIIKGYRADDSYFSFARDFVNNSISVEQLSKAMQLGKLGEQVVLKSKKAFDRIVYLENETVFADSSIFFPKREKRNEDAKAEYLNVNSTFDNDGLYILDIIRKKMTSSELDL